jgi:hypothetical protein
MHLLAQLFKRGEITKRLHTSDNPPIVVAQNRRTDADGGSASRPS